MNGWMDEYKREKQVNDFVKDLVYKNKNKNKNK